MNPSYDHTPFKFHKLFARIGTPVFTDMFPAIQSEASITSDMN